MILFNSKSILLSEKQFHFAIELFFFFFRQNMDQQHQQRKPQQQQQQSRGPKPEEKPSRTLFIRNVQYETPEKEIQEMFSKFGEIRKFFNIVAKRGMAFVTYVKKKS